MEKRDIRICFVGDSFVNGTGDPDFLGWTGRVCRAALTDAFELTHYNLGIRRDTSADIRRRWQAETTARLPISSDNRVVFSFGVNDTTLENGQPRVSPQDSIANARAILTQAMRQYPTLMIGPLPIDDTDQNARSKALDASYAQLCAAISIPYLSVFNTMYNHHEWLDEVKRNDGAHPFAKGYTALAIVVQAWDAWWFQA